MGGFADEDLVKDGWTDIAQRIRDRMFAAMTDLDGDETGPELFAKVFAESDDEKMTEIRARCDEIVDDPATGEALKPWYRQLCKRPCFHDEYLQAYNEPTCHLVDTDGKGVERIDETGVWVGDTHYELDCLVFASGFEVHLSHFAAYETVGRDGLALSEHWSDGMRSLHGAHVHGFPNLFIEGMSQGANLISNITHNLNESARSIAAVVTHALESGAQRVEVTEEAEQAWVELLDGNSMPLLGNPDCTPGYYNKEGEEITRADRRNVSGYPAGPAAFFDFIDAWRSSGDFEGLEFR
jgi:cation diffusion facilitator CzcD-associated flavoprotein CzcO